MQLLQFYYVTIHSAFRYGFGALSDVCNCKLCKYLVFWILVPFLSTMQSALQAGQKGKKYIQKLPSLWQMATFSHSFCFYLLQFNSHQTLICLLVQLIVLILCYHILQYVYEICLAIFSMSITLRDDSIQHYFGDDFYAMLV